MEGAEVEYQEDEAVLPAIVGEGELWQTAMVALAVLTMLVAEVQ